MSNSFSPLKETDILREICLYLKVKRHFFWRQNNTGVYRHSIGRYIPAANSMKGIPDIFVLKPGPVLFGIEGKTAKGRQSDDQKNFETEWKKRGGVYVLARCVQDVIEAGL